MSDEPIYSYGDDDAIADGELVHPYPDKFPWVLLSRSVHAAIEEEVAKGQRTYDQCAIPLVMDAAMAYSAAEDKGLTVLEGTVAGTVWIMPNERRWTILLPSDY